MNISNISKIFSHPLHFIAFGFGAGLSPIAPGTMGSLVAIPIIFLMSFLSFPLYALITLFIILIGTYAADWSSKDLKVHDHSGIVIDEIAGMIVMMMFVPINTISVIIGFILFRFFDIVKPWPIGWVDKHLEGGIGIMMDDLLAGIFAGIILTILSMFFKLSF